MWVSIIRVRGSRSQATSPTPALQQQGNIPAPCYAALHDATVAMKAGSKRSPSIRTELCKCCELR